MSKRAADIVIGTILAVVTVASFVGAFVVASSAAANTLVGVLLFLWVVAFIVWMRWG